MIPPGGVAYDCSSGAVGASGKTFTDSELESELVPSAVRILADATGHQEIREVLGAVAATEFMAENLEKVLEAEQTLEITANW